MVLSRQEIQAIIDRECEWLNPHRRFEDEFNEWVAKTTKPTPRITWEITTVIEDYQIPR